jgi:hypothetical protein
VGTPLAVILENDSASAVVLWERAKRAAQNGRKVPLSQTAEQVYVAADEFTTTAGEALLSAG